MATETFWLEFEVILFATTFFIQFKSNEMV